MEWIVVTGANRGLGFEFVRQYIGEGRNVVAACRDPEIAVELRTLREGDGILRTEHLDLSNDESIMAFVERLEDISVGLIINNAGVTPLSLWQNEPMLYRHEYVQQRFGTLNADVWSRVFRINTIAPVILTQAMRKLLPNNCNAKIVMISSRLASFSLDVHDYIPYATSKTALNMAMRKIAQSLEADNIVVVSINPGTVKTTMALQGAEQTPEQSVTSMRKVINNLKSEDSGKFINFDGRELPW